MGQADEGICLLLRLGPYRVLLDCGLHDITPLMADPEGGALPLADVVFCSHAHPDHARGLRALHHAWPQLPIYASEVTAHLLPLNWSLAPLEGNPDHFCQALPWRSPLELGPGLSVELFPVGHLPGAAAFLISYQPDPTRPELRYTVFYTGDFFLSNSRLVEGLPLEELRGLAPDVLIIEGSFGTSRHPHRRQQENQLAERLSQSIKQGISTLLPVPVLGLGQELLMLLRSHHYFTGQNIDIWVGPAIAAGCDAYLDILPHLPSSVRNFAQHQSLFWDQRVKPRVQRLPPEAPLPFGPGSAPCIVLTNEQLNLQDYYCPGGPPWLLMLPRQTSSIAQSGSPTPEIIDPILADFATEIAEGQILLDSYLLAEHSDGPGTTQLIHNLRPQHVVFVHGNPNYLADLSGLEELSNRYHLHCPTAGVAIELALGATLMPTLPTVIHPVYEGEIAELEVTGVVTGTIEPSRLVSITLPGDVITDPRWRSLADTGLITATWQGDDLVIKGLSARDLLLERGSTQESMACCATCEFCRQQRCWNEASALHGFKVSLDGYCPAYAPVGVDLNEDLVEDLPLDPEPDAESSA
jgi:Cft2 family RNA processing exonuclease